MLLYCNKKLNQLRTLLLIGLWVLCYILVPAIAWLEYTDNNKAGRYRDYLYKESVLLWNEIIIKWKYFKKL